MTQPRYDFCRFLRAESGAVTVDYVLLAAAVTGMALATSGVLTEGMAVLAGNIDSELSGEPVGGVAGLTYSDNFDNGASGWGGAQVTDVRGLGKVLGPITGTTNGQQSVTRQFQIDPHAATATFSFDVLAMDTLDNESGIFYIDGYEVGRVTSDHGNTTFTPKAGLTGITVRATAIDNAVQLGGAPDRADGKDLDSRTSILVSVDNSVSPKQWITFGFGSNADQNASDESFALDNFRATGLKDPGSTS